MEKIARRRRARAGAHHDGVRARRGAGGRRPVPATTGGGRVRRPRKTPDTAPAPGSRTRSDSPRRRSGHEPRTSTSACCTRPNRPSPTPSARSPTATEPNPTSTSSATPWPANATHHGELLAPGRAALRRGHARRRTRAAARRRACPRPAADRSGSCATCRTSTCSPASSTSPGRWSSRQAPRLRDKELLAVVGAMRRRNRRAARVAADADEAGRTAGADRGTLTARPRRSSAGYPAGAVGESTRATPPTAVSALRRSPRVPRSDSGPFVT